ncbi:unnamed protein product [Schistosoma margrebowiei]|uniref:Uncharacterized protein n=1 Tax=Schistosoma margrebowiei TaxID=48269 RepID=A0A183M9G4_9TREM|nr:unnamed protein product [Schistosoma margrebowiei]
MDLEKLEKVMSKFESQFEDLDIRSSTMENSMKNIFTLSAPEDEINSLIKQVGHQIGLAMSLESLHIDVCCLSETRIQDSGEVLGICSTSVTSKSLFYVRLFGDPVAPSSGLAGVGSDSFKTTDETLEIQYK